MNPNADMVFEVSWEVCNKVGGIFTVVSSKALSMMQCYDFYYLVGPFFPKKAFGVFEETVVPEECKTAAENLKKQGVECHWGTWLVKGNPRVILIDFTQFSSQKNEIKRKLWDEYHVDSLYTEWFDFDEPVVFATAAGKVIEELSRVYAQKKVVAQFHEWLTGAGLLYLKSRKIPVGTVFTTHATTLGRTIAATDMNLYEVLDVVHPDECAQTRGAGVFAKHMLEKAAAQHASVFTTVSEITGLEAEKILGRKPDVLLLNGLDMDKFPTFEEASVKHRLFKNRIKQFLTYYFFPHYAFDLANTLIYFLAGRYEFTDKGVDVCIEALGKLNERLKKEKSTKTVVTFFWIPGNIRAIKTDLLEDKTAFFDVKDSLDDAAEDMKTNILYTLLTKKKISEESVFDSDFVQDIKPKLLRMRKQGNPTLTTHDLFDETTDQILAAFRACSLFNREEDRVKVVFYPIYLTGADGLLDAGYYESMQGSHLGIFPSYYEPWGYTPLEAAALGVASVTTDLAGFGRYVLSQGKQSSQQGIFVLPRYKRTREQIITDLANMLYVFSQLPTQDRINNKITAHKLSRTADWKNFIQYYIEAHNLAVSKSY